MDSCGFPTKIRWNDSQAGRASVYVLQDDVWQSTGFSQLNGAEGDVSLEDFIADVIFSGYSADTNMHQN